MSPARTNNSNGILEILNSWFKFSWVTSGCKARGWKPISLLWALSQWTSWEQLRTALSRSAEGRSQTRMAEAQSLKGQGWLPLPAVRVESWKDLCPLSLQGKSRLPSLVSDCWLWRLFSSSEEYPWAGNLATARRCKRTEHLRMLYQVLYAGLGGSDWLGLLL